MRKKKLLSIVLASALMVASMPIQAFAAPSPAGSSMSGVGNIDGGSTVGSNALLKIVVPTDLSFIINPLELKVGTDTSQIISTGYAFINKSNMDVQVAVTPYFATAEGVTVATAPEEITNTAGEAPTVYMQINPETTKAGLTKDVNDKFSFVTTGAVFTTDGAVTVAGTEASAQSVFFKLKSLKTAYASDGTNMTYDEKVATAADTDAIAFKFNGKVSQMSNWSAEAVKLGVKVKYDFSFISNKAYTDAVQVGSAYNVVAGSLAEDGPTFTAKADGTFSITGATGYDLNGLYYISSPSTITATKADIQTAFLDGSMKPKGYDIKPLTSGSSFTITKNSEGGIGELTAVAKSSVSGKHVIFLTKLTKSTGDNTLVISSKDTLMN